MNEEKEQEEKERMELGHEAVPGYKPVFFITITIGVLYLALILLKTLF